MSIDLKSELERRGMRLADVARALGVNKSTVTRWFSTRPPAERVPDVERVTGISRYILRPEIYGPAPEQRRAS